MAGLYCKNVLQRFGDIQRGETTRARSSCSLAFACSCSAMMRKKNLRASTSRPTGQTRIDDNRDKNGGIRNGHCDTNSIRYFLGKLLTRSYKRKGKVFTFSLSITLFQSFCTGLLKHSSQALVPGQQVDFYYFIVFFRHRYIIWSGTGPATPILVDVEE